MPIVVGCATGCLEVSTTIYPYSSWKTPFIHNAFENSAATVSGVEAAFKGLQRAGKIPADKKIKFVAFGGDGGTYDIGLQSLSGAMERGHDMVYVCYDNGAYMNTGIQRSSATPKGAWATTAEVGRRAAGQDSSAARTSPRSSPRTASRTSRRRRSATGRTSPTRPRRRSRSTGPAFLNVFAPCPRGWRIPYDKTVEIAKLAVQTGFWPLYEVEDGEWRIRPSRSHNRKPIEEFLKPQGRFKHLFKPGNEALLAEIQADVDRNLGAHRGPLRRVVTGGGSRSERLRA